MSPKLTIRQCLAAWEDFKESQRWIWEMKRFFLSSPVEQILATLFIYLEWKQALSLDHPASFKAETTIVGSHSGSTPSRRSAQTWKVSEAWLWPRGLHASVLLWQQSWGMHRRLSVMGDPALSLYLLPSLGVGGRRQVFLGLSFQLKTQNKTTLLKF